MDAYNQEYNRPRHNADDGSGIMKTARWIFLLIPFAVLTLMILAAVLRYATSPGLGEILTPVELNTSTVVTH